MLDVCRKPLFVGTGTDHQDKILKSILSYADSVRTLGDMPSRFTLLNTHPAIEAEPTRSLRQLFFPEEDEEPDEPQLRRKGGKGKDKGKAKATPKVADSRRESLDLNTAGAVAVMDERTKEEALDLLIKMLSFDPDSRYRTPVVGHVVSACADSVVCACACVVCCQGSRPTTRSTIRSLRASRVCANGGGASGSVPTTCWPRCATRT
jgi:hypothetical protein